ncbi:CobW family GTP-binding protein [Falsigemmobacter faecalis]|uniref:CobW family GTP-binding protein n=1 Tax=Falsigemmobacter faecalis TaxID=2488730 RepID=UPI001F488006|nr:GTP-binding protein [Falsigemmobacter faecalis]
MVLITGFLGAGKTTLINDLLRGDHGLRIAAIVNDFGAINIDAALLRDAADTVVGLENGCICCALQGDLLRSLRLVLERAPELIVIEASGAADPRGILEVLSDPILIGHIRTDAVAALVDAADISARPARLRDPLWQAQIRAADFVLLSKGPLTPALRAQLAPFRKPLLPLEDEGLPLALLLGDSGALRAPAEPGRVTADHLQSLEWESALPLDPAAFSAVLHQIAPQLLRAKGWLRFAPAPQELHLLQLAGQRAALSPAAPRPDVAGAKLVLIGLREGFAPDALTRALDQTRLIG